MKQSKKETIKLGWAGLFLLISGVILIISVIASIWVSDPENWIKTAKTSGLFCMIFLLMSFWIYSKIEGAEKMEGES